MAATPRLLTHAEMLDVARMNPIFNEQLRASVITAVVDRTLTPLCKRVDPSRRFYNRVRAYSRGEIQHLDMWEMLSLFAAIHDLDAPLIKRNPPRYAGLGRKKGQGFPAPNPPTFHSAISDIPD